MTTSEIPLLPQSDSSFTVSSSGGLSSGAPPTQRFGDDLPLIDLDRLSSRTAIRHEQEENGAVPIPVHVDESENEEETAEDNQEIRGSDDDEQEDPKDYCKGGYHPVTIGSLFNQRYHVIRKLGWGKQRRANAKEADRLSFTHYP